MNKPLTLLFDPYESVALFLSGNEFFILLMHGLWLTNILSPVLTVNYVVQDGKSNWLEGFVLMCMTSYIPMIAYDLCDFRSISHFGSHLLVLSWLWYACHVISL